MTLAVHVSDTIDLRVAWANAEGRTLPDNITTTTWSTVDAAGNPVTGWTVSPDAADDEHATISPPLAEGTFFAQASTPDQAGTPVLAKSPEDINVADNNPAVGTVTVVLNPV